MQFQPPQFNTQPVQQMQQAPPQFAQQPVQQMQQAPQFAAPAFAPQPVAPKEPAGHSDTKKFLARLLDDYVHGSLVQPNYSKTKKGAFGKTSPQRSTTNKRIEKQQSELNPNVPKNWMTESYTVVLLNIIGDASLLSEYLPTKLNRVKSGYHDDIGQLAVYGIMNNLRSRTGTTIFSSNYTDSGDVKVLKYFNQYKGKTDEQRKVIVNEFFNDFVLGFYDACIAAVNEIVMPTIDSNGGIANYNFYQATRLDVRNKLFHNFLDEISNRISVIIDTVLMPNVETMTNDAYFKAVHEERVKSESNTISIMELPSLMKKLSVIKGVTCNLPSWIRKEDPISGVTKYSDLDLQAEDATKLAYIHGVNWKAASIDGKTEISGGPAGTRKATVLTDSQAAGKIIKTIGKHFDSIKGKVANKNDLLNHVKYIDIVKANIKTGTGLQLTPTNENIIIPFPINTNFSSVMSSEQFAALPPSSQVDIIISNVGFTASKMNHDMVKAFENDLYGVFGVTNPNRVVNLIPKKGEYLGGIGSQPQQNFATAASPQFQPVAQPAGTFTL